MLQLILLCKINNLGGFMSKNNDNMEEDYSYGLYGDYYYTSDQKKRDLVTTRDEPIPECEHKPKKVIVSANLRFYVCSKCKKDLGNIE